MYLYLSNLQKMPLLDVPDSQCKRMFSGELQDHEQQMTSAGAESGERKHLLLVLLDREGARTITNTSIVHVDVDVE